jgi:hypothetical protein
MFQFYILAAGRIGYRLENPDRDVPLFQFLADRSGI